MRIGCGTPIAPRRAHIAGCRGTAVCADTQCLLRHCVSVVANGTREHLWDGPRFPAAMACSMEAAEAACAAADANEAADASAASATASRAGAEAPRATTGRTLVRVRALLCHAERHPVRACEAGCCKAPGCCAMPVGAVRVLRWLPRPILSCGANTHKTTWPVAASRARPEACWAQGRRDPALQSVAAADALRRPQTLSAERAAADADGVPTCVGCGRPMDSLPLSFAHLARALHMGD
jgi:hypothetical protein